MLLTLYYSQEPHYSRSNFGDGLAPLIFERAFSTPVCFAPIHKADAISIGSLAECLFFERFGTTPLRRQQIRIRYLWARRTPITMWGTGMHHDDIYPFALRSFDAKALRGKLSQQALAPDTQLPLGDPGLLTDMLLQTKPEKKYRVGLIPHYHHKVSRWVDWCEDNVQGITLIDVERDPMTVVHKISQCDIILSSALHGLVVADSLGIPNRWLMFDDVTRETSRWKYDDYYSAFSAMAAPDPFMVSEQSIQPFFASLEKALSDYARPGLAQLKQALVDSFPFK